MTSTAVIQTKQGIGDVMWHLPFIRAIAAATPERAVTFLTLPSSFARDLLRGEACVAETLYYENRGSEWARGLHLARLIGTLRARRFTTLWILDRSVRPAIAALAAGIPNRIGLGFGQQRLFITNPGIDPRYRPEHPIEWLKALMAAMQLPLPDTEPNLTLPPALRAELLRRYQDRPRPWIVLGIGASAPQRDWSDAQWSAFLDELRRRSTGTAFLIGGPGNAARAAALIAAGRGAEVNACTLSIAESAALIGGADLYLGPDSGPLNVAAAVGTPAFGLFAVNPVLDYSRFIHPILPDDGRRSPDGMARTSPGRVLDAIAPHLASPTASAPV
ncbi:glycosyltransferase family 9 protein [Rhodopseudomonas palustris]|uniref:Glycosyl transferase, family 9 n=1 Tax=Rhodopseudomonas palustris (strain BisB18) TaxID=316056 RepID=Q20WS6_RHOPB